MDNSILLGNTFIMLFFKFFENFFMSIRWSSTLIVLLEGVWTFRHVLIFFVIARVNILVVFLLSLESKSLYLIRLW